MLKLHRVQQNKPIWINPRAVMLVVPSDRDETSCHVRFDSYTNYHISKPPEEVIALLNVTMLKFNLVAYSKPIWFNPDAVVLIVPADRYEGTCHVKFYADVSYHINEDAESLFAQIAKAQAEGHIDG